MKIFILGGAGFIGYHATHELLARGHQVRTLSLPPLPVDGLLPSGVDVRLGDFNALSDEAILDLFEGCQGVVFAAGADDRVTPRAPAIDFFRSANVAPTRRFFRLARQAGAARGVLLSSYFAHFDRQRPEMQLSDHHPYIRSRREQAEAAFEVCGQDLSLAVLELPYIFGRMPGRRPLWCPLIRYLRSPLPWIFYPRGGTAMVSVGSVAAAIAGALEKDVPAGFYQIGDENLTWQAFLARLGRAARVQKPVVTLPDGLVRLGLRGVHWLHKLRGREGGLSPVPFLALQTAETFFDPAPAHETLGFTGGDLDEAFRDTVRGCGYLLESK